MRFRSPLSPTAGTGSRFIGTIEHGLDVFIQVHGGQRPVVPCFSKALPVKRVRIVFQRCRQETAVLHGYSLFVIKRGRGYSPACFFVFSCKLFSPIFKMNTPPLFVPHRAGTGFRAQGGLPSFWGSVRSQTSCHPFRADEYNRIGNWPRPGKTLSPVPGRVPPADTRAPAGQVTGIWCLGGGPTQPETPKNHPTAV